MAVTFAVALVLTLWPQGPVTVDITPKSKEPLRGQWSAASVAIDAEFGSATVKVARLDRIEFGSPDLVVTDAGLELRGEVKLRSFEFKIDGKTRRFSAADLAAISVVRGESAPVGKDFAGEWMTSFGPMRLERRGTKIKGTYGFGDTGSIEGSIKAGVLEFEYRDDDGSGNGSWKLEDGGAVLLGSFGKEERFWGAYRRTASLPPLQPGAVVEGQTKVGMRCCIRAPKAFDAARKWPAICILHGSNMSSRAYVDTIVATWPELAEQYLVIGLDGERISSNSKPGALAFNYTYINFGGPGRGPAWVHRQSPALVADSLEQLEVDLPITKWFLGGHSQGGFLSYCLAMYYPERLAGVFPMSCNLLVQCEPDCFDGEAVERQRELGIAVIHGQADDVVEYSGGAYCHLRMLDGGMPFVRLFAPERVGHQFAWLPVAEAVQWLAACAAEDAAELVTFAEERAKAEAWRDVGALLARLAARKAGGPLAQRIKALQDRVAAVAGPPAQRLGEAIKKDKDGRWVDDFLVFRAEFGTTAAAAPVLAAYDALRQQQREQGDELFGKARRADDKTAREAIYREILKTCYATKWYAAVKLWMQ